MILNDLPVLSKCIPHSGPMRLIDRYLSWDPDEQLCQTVGSITSRRRSVNERGEFKSEWLLEMMAQGVAAHFYLTGSQNCPPKPGFLVSVRKYKLLVTPKIHMGNELIIKSKFEAGIFPVGNYQSEIFLGKICLAEANMTFLISEKGEWH